MSPSAPPSSRTTKSSFLLKAAENIEDLATKIQLVLEVWKDDESRIFTLVDQLINAVRADQENGFRPDITDHLLKIGFFNQNLSEEKAQKVRDYLEEMRKCLRELERDGIQLGPNRRMVLPMAAAKSKSEEVVPQQRSSGYNEEGEFTSDESDILPGDAVDTPAVEGGVLGSASVGKGKNVKRKRK